MNYVKFEINNQKFGEKDSVIKLQINKYGLDKCKAIIAHDTLNFLTKFIENELYEIEQGCCCAAFIFKAHKNPRRGTITFRNRTKADLGLIIAEANIDTVKAKTNKTTFASESAMCYFKPCSILITKTEYMSPKYDYNSDNRDYETLWKEQEKLILASTWFHFLHGEKIEVFYSSKHHKLKIKLKGYLQKHEYKNN
ncbi:MAG: hypothetical protein MUC49_19445 [Raineya sp.]|jgi:hypothetical protein|nr:hypothetical protein [Raineya sp.]